ncbi:MAG: type III secretion system export apparatus subunit SctR [Aquisalinus sp.]|nr:type III secretion system export apparatus subunit SctR [Aquisalinus sp.]
MDPSSLNPSSTLVTVILLALAPLAVVMLTSFTKIVVTLSLLRNAIGLQQSPPNVVLNGLALVLTVYIMYPVGLEIADRMPPLTEEQRLTDPEVLTAVFGAAKEPIREFMMTHAPERERAFFLRTAQRALPAEHAADLTSESLLVVIPAFTVSELAAAFQIGFMIFLPFLIIDLFISNILLSLGMMMLPPTIVSLPFKLLLFVLLDGWIKLAHGLIISYQV